MSLDQIYVDQARVSSADKAALLAQLSALDPELFNQVQDAIAFTSSGVSAADIDQLPASSLFSLLADAPNSVSEADQKRYYDLGLKLIAQSKVAVLLMAGGQGTRLGSSNPKGTYVIDIPSENSLFELQAKKIKRLEKLTGGKIYWYVMTSEATRAKTEAYFVDKDYFGLDRKDVKFFNQGTLPAFTADGKKIYRETKDSLTKSPDGNGGLYKGIYDNGLLDDFAAKGIEHIHMYAVDNCLAKVADPLFIGFSVANQFDLATKVVRKNEPSESVGLIISKNGKPSVIEYSEISDELASKKDAKNNQLLFLRAANIVQHYYSVALLKLQIPAWIRSREALPYHVAKKKIPHLNLDDEYVKPTEANGIKLEQFIFDIFPTVDLSKFGSLEVKREQEFSPLKNAPGTKSDNPQTSARDLQRLHTHWVVSQGGKVQGEGLIELDGALTYGGENLEGVRGQTYKSGQFITEL